MRDPGERAKDRRKDRDPRKKPEGKDVKPTDGKDDPRKKPENRKEGADGAPANPLLMMPMRLEYRMVSQGKPPMVAASPEYAETLLKLRTNLVETPPEDTGTILELTALIEELTHGKNERVTLRAAEVKTDTEIWLRWYPDSNFAESSVAPVSKDEDRARQAYLDHPDARDWPKLPDDKSIALWAEFVAIAGLARAVHLMRTKDAADPEYWQQRTGRIAGLPVQIAVFGHIDGALVLLGMGNKIPQNTKWGAGLVSYSPAALDDVTWLSDFPTALALGMGMKLTDPEQVEIAQKADWLICVGLSEEDGVQGMTDLLNDQIATGEFEILQQDTPTNNTPTALAGLEEGETVISKLEQSTGFELGHTNEKGGGAHRLAAALGMADDTVLKAKGAFEAGHLNAAAMIRIIGPALMDGSLAASKTMQGVSDTDFIELLAQHVQARGLLPSMRVGGGAYGVVPVTDTTTGPSKNYGLTATENDFEGFIQGYISGIKPLLVSASEQLTLRLSPDDPDASEKFVDILQTSRVSRRIDVSAEAANDVDGLGCPYVAGPKEPQTPTAYFSTLLDRPVRDLPRPTQKDLEWPLLYRLAHLTVLRNRELEVVKGSNGFMNRGSLRMVQGRWINRLNPQQRNAVNQSRQFSVKQFSELTNAQMNLIPNIKRGPLRIINRQFAGAILRLRRLAARPDGDAHLETLMMEVIDMFQHRLDAWISGLASIRLAFLRNKYPESGLTLGYYGMLGALRSPNDAGKAGGYVQAPSQGQAVTAAILRSTFLRNRGEGAFEIDLSSNRTRKALNLMDHIRHGVPLPEALGLRGERWLRDALKSAVIFELRDDFPLENPDTDGNGARGGTGVRCFDGLRFLDAPVGNLTLDQRALRAVLHDSMDAFADLIVAEAVHHRAAGAADVASAWLRVLSGGPIPHRPEFLRTLRSGQASDYRVTLLLPPTSPATSGTPIRMAEYGLAAMIDRAVPGLNEANVRAELRLGTQTLHKIDINLFKHLGLDAITIAKLGLEPFKRRIEAHVIASFHATFPLKEVRNTGWILDRAGIEAAGAVIELELGDVETWVEEAAQLWNMAHAAQPLSASDLSNAADPARPLDEPTQIEALTYVASDVWARADRLGQQLSKLSKNYESSLRTVFTLVSSGYKRNETLWGTSTRTDAELHASVSKLHLTMDSLALWQLLPSPDRPAVQRLITQMVDSEALLRKPLVEMKRRLELLRTNVGKRINKPATLSDARADLSLAIEIVRQVTGVATLAIFPIFEKTPALAPLLNGQRAVKETLAPWDQYRAKLARMADHLPSSYRGYAVKQDATADDADVEDADRRDETIAPRAYHRGVFLSHPSDLIASTLSGLVIDEWVETRPSTQQDAAIAFNYDVPEAEAPNCLLLGVPQDAFASRWDEKSAAGMVGELVDLMRMRALTTQTTPISDTVLPLANQVSHMGQNQNERPRIPVAKFKAGVKDWFIAPGLRQVLSDKDLDDVSGSWNQTNLSGPIRRTPK